MLREITELGFAHAELSHGIRITLVPGILRAVEQGLIRISSTHNFCPLPTGVVQAAPNLFEPSSTDHREHEQWVRHTKRSIDFAAQVGAEVLVCHLGSVHFFWFHPGRKVDAYLDAHPEAGRREDAAYATLLRKSLARLRARQPKFWTQVKASIQEVLEHARQKKVKLGFENREKFGELPLDDEFSAFLAEFPAGSPVGYWHDTGHADIKEGMGLLNHRAHLEKLAPAALGFHLHDVSADGHDHQPIGEGHIDFQMVASHWRPHHRLTIELGPRVTREGVLASRQKVESLLAKA